MSTNDNFHYNFPGERNAIIFFTPLGEIESDREELISLMSQKCHRNCYVLVRVQQLIVFLVINAVTGH